MVSFNYQKESQFINCTTLVGKTLSLEHSHWKCHTPYVGKI